MNLGPVITSKGNARVKLLRASFNGKAHAPGDLVGLEGEHLVFEAIRSGLRIETIFLRQGSEGVLARLAWRDQYTPQYMLLSSEVFASAVDTQSPQGIAALVAIPSIDDERDPNKPDLFLALEAIQDPGNLGTLLRTAEAFGVQTVYLSPDTANLWNSKTVRASAGSVFRVPARRITLREAKANHSQNAKWVAAVAQADGAMASHDAELAGPCVVLVGNEGAGLSKEALELADELIHIPCQTESLNAAVAGSVLLYEAMRQRLATQSGQNEARV